MTEKDLEAMSIEELDEKLSNVKQKYFDEARRISDVRKRKVEEWHAQERERSAAILAEAGTEDGGVKVEPPTARLQKKG